MSVIPEQLCLEAAQMASSVHLRAIYVAKILFSIVGSFSVLHLHKTKVPPMPFPIISSPGHGVDPQSECQAPLPGTYLLHFPCLFLLWTRLHLPDCEVVLLLPLLYLSVFRPEAREDAPCSFVLNARFSCLIKLIPVFAIHSQSFNMFTFAIERALSTFFHKRYEILSKPYVGIFLLVLSALCPVLK